MNFNFIIERMSRTIRTHLPFLTVLYKAHTKQRRALLRSLSDEQFQVLCEVALNIYKGTIHLSHRQIKTLVPFKSVLEFIINKHVRKTLKLKRMIEKQNVFSIILKPVLNFFNNVKGTNRSSKRQVLEPFEGEQTRESGSEHLRSNGERQDESNSLRTLSETE